ncbi:energy transducer TonB, partial [Porticoccaceae bacterium]|nr:energy transducer TonB [Porticoccaceae bacterium]
DYSIGSKQNISESPVGEIYAESKISQPLALSRTSSKVISKVAPIYPRTAERKGTQGVVELSYRVSTSGRAISIEVVQEVPLGKGFAKASIAALKQYKFSSATENGAKVISEKRVQKFTFK